MRRAATLAALLGVASGQLLTEGYVANNIKTLWASFRRTHRPGPYASEEEERTRFTTFAENMVKAAVLQRESPRATFGVGPLSDLTEAEFKAMRGFGPAPKTLRAPKGNATAAKVAVSSIDWRDKGAVTAVKNQNRCGDCGGALPAKPKDNPGGKWKVAAANAKAAAAVMGTPIAGVTWDFAGGLAIDMSGLQLGSNILVSTREDVITVQEHDDHRRLAEEFAARHALPGGRKRAAPETCPGANTRPGSRPQPDGMRRG